MPTPHPSSSAVQRALRKLGTDLRDARRRRHLPMAIVAERAFTSRSTLQKIEEGDPGVSIGIYCAVRQALGLLDELSQVADISKDSVGLAQSTACRELSAGRQNGKFALFILWQRAIIHWVSQIPRDWVHCASAVSAKNPFKRPIEPVLFPAIISVRDRIQCAQESLQGISRQGLGASCPRQFQKKKIPGAPDRERLFQTSYRLRRSACAS